MREKDEDRGELGHITNADLIPLKELPERSSELAKANGSDGGVFRIYRVTRP